jgi:hypothetical protein
MLTKRINVTLLVLAVAGTGVLIGNSKDDATATPAASPSLQVVAPTPAAHAPVPHTPPAVPGMPLEASLSEQVDRLLATHDPENALAAYLLLSHCDEFNRLHDRLMSVEAVTNGHANKDKVFDYRGMTESEKQHDKMLCSPMTERMRQSRIDYLAVAAKAGVAGGSRLFAQEGPFGDRSALTSRPDDLLVQEWKKTARAQLMRDAETGDSQALEYLWIQNITGNVLYEISPALVFRYGVAAGKIYEDINGATEASAWFFGAKSPFVQPRIKDMRPEQRAAEVVQAERIADTARQRRKRVVDKT